MINKKNKIFSIIYLTAKIKVSRVFVRDTEGKNPHLQNATKTSQTAVLINNI